MALNPCENVGSFNGATPFQAWKHLGYGYKQRAAVGFNGATPFQAWKRDPPVVACAGHHASMGPRLFRRGNARIERNVNSYRMASMGPRLFRRGNVRLIGIDTPESTKLQWGHAFSGVETINAAIGQERSPVASMGPRLFRRGN